MNGQPRHERSIVAISVVIRISLCVFSSGRGSTLTAPCSAVSRCDTRHTEPKLPMPSDSPSSHASGSSGIGVDSRGTPPIIAHTPRAERLLATRVANRRS